MNTSRRLKAVISYPIDKTGPPLAFSTQVFLTPSNKSDHQYRNLNVETLLWLMLVNERGKDSTEMLEFVKRLVVSLWAHWVLRFFVNPVEFEFYSQQKSSEMIIESSYKQKTKEKAHVPIK